MLSSLWIGHRKDNYMKILKKIDYILEQYEEYYSDSKFDWFGAIKMFLVAIVIIFLLYLIIT